MSTPPPPSPPPPPPSPYQPPASSGRRPPAPGGARLPWEERDRLGFVEAFVETVKLIVISPSDAFSRLRADGDLTSPMLFGIIFSWVCMLISQLWNLVLTNSLRDMFGAAEGLDAFFRAPSIFELIGTLLFWPIIYVVIIFVGAAIMHVCLLIVGATTASPMGFEGTIKVYAYATVTWISVVLPFAGGIVGSLWNLVLAVIGFSEVHRTSQGRALVAVLIPTILCCACILLTAAMFGAAMVEFIRQAGALP